MASLVELVRYLDEYLQTAKITDYSGAQNGLQLENGGTVTKVGAAVDASEAVVGHAAAAGVDLLLVHHGLFWTPQRYTGATYRKLKQAMGCDLAIYSSHLPLDLHAEVGNNAQLCRALGWAGAEPAFPYKGQPIGLKVAVETTRTTLQERLGQVLGGLPHCCPGGPEVVRRVGIVTGGAGSEVAQAVAEGVDTFITGEGPHWSFPAAEELGLNVFYGGHYRTETFGVKALAAHLEVQFGLPWVFLDHPTGL